ncbi:MAG: hypothetical protein Q8O99_06105 [bacterium]|nr:hypothetical protein [bacterium]
MHYTQPDVYEFISRQTNDPIVERKTCRLSGTKFPIYQSDLEFYDKISPVFAGEKYPVPTPTLCPEERFRRRSSFRNSLSLYRRKCDATQRDVVSMYKPDPKNIVYDNDVRRSDSRNALSYGKSFDFSKTFTEQFRPHRQQVPKMARVQQGENENAIYTNTASDNKDCYLIGDATHNEHCFYGLFVDECTWCIDNYAIVHNEHAYESILCGNNYHIFFSMMIDDSHHIYHCRSIQNCSFMFACVGMANAQYCILNKQVTKEEFEAVLRDPDHQEDILQTYTKELLPIAPLLYNDAIQCE